MPWTACASRAATATLLKKQKPIAAAGRRDRVGVELPAAAAHDPVDRRDVARRVHACDLPGAGRLGRARGVLAGQPVLLERCYHPAQTVDALRVVGPGVVAEHLVVVV